MIVSKSRTKNLLPITWGKTVEIGIARLPEREVLVKYGTGQKDSHLQGLCARETGATCDFKQI